jgi:DNA-binding NtrC family response regulator
MPPSLAQAAAPAAGVQPRSLARDVELLERAQIERMLREVGGNKTAAAQRLGVSRRTLYRKLAEFQQRHPAPSHAT